MLVESVESHEKCARGEDDRAPPRADVCVLYKDIMRLIYIVLNLLLFGISTHDSAFQHSDVNVADAFSERQADVDANANDQTGDQFDQKVDTSLIKLTPAIITAKLGRK